MSSRSASGRTRSPRRRDRRRSRRARARRRLPAREPQRRPAAAGARQREGPARRDPGEDHVGADDRLPHGVLDHREQRTLALAAALGKRVAWDRILRRMALVLPDDVWLTNLTGNMPLDAGGGDRARRPDHDQSAFPPRPRRCRSRATRTDRRGSHGLSSGSRSSPTSRTSSSSRLRSPRSTTERLQLHDHLGHPQRKG